MVIAILFGDKLLCSVTKMFTNVHISRISIQTARCAESPPMLRLILFLLLPVTTYHVPEFRNTRFL